MLVGLLVAAAVVVAAEIADAVAATDERIDVAVINSGALRQDIDAGIVTKGDLISAFPFPNTLVMTKLKGTQVREIFNHAAGMTNGVLQISENSSYSFTPGEQVDEIWIKGELVADEEEYWVAAPNFVTQGKVSAKTVFLENNNKLNSQIKIE